jgi:sortase A
MRRTLGAIGRVLVTVGILLLLFVTYQLWGTGIYQARQQDHLRSQFEHSLQRAAAPATTTPATTTPSTTPATATTLAPIAVPAGGNALGIISIPKIGVNQVVVEGVDVDDLRKGPGHYPFTQLPGHAGNTAIAGHRTTYGAPFGNLDQLNAGDRITVTTVQGKFTYQVTTQQVVDPSDVAVLAAPPAPAHPGPKIATLTLTTCNPKYSAAQRLVVKGNLVLDSGAQPLPAVATPKGAVASIDGLSGETSSRTPTIIWAVIAAIIGLLWWLAFHRHPRWPTWFVGAVPFLVALFFCYSYLERLLPSNY